MYRKFLFRARLCLIALSMAPIGTAAQPTGAVPPVPGPYLSVPAPAASGAIPNPARPALANPYSNPTHRPAVPYWMQRPQGQGGSAAAPAGTNPQFIPGWVWSPSAQNRPPAAPQGQARPPAPAGNAGWSPYYGQGYGYGANPGTARPGNLPQMAPGGNAAWPQPPAPPAGYWNQPPPGQPYWPGYPAPPNARNAPSN